MSTKNFAPILQLINKWELDGAGLAIQTAAVDLTDAEMAELYGSVSSHQRIADEVAALENCTEINPDFVLRRLAALAQAYASLPQLPRYTTLLASAKQTLLDQQKQRITALLKEFHADIARNGPNVSSLSDLEDIRQDVINLKHPDEAELIKRVNTEADFTNEQIQKQKIEKEFGYALGRGSYRLAKECRDEAEKTGFFRIEIPEWDKKLATLAAHRSGRSSKIEGGIVNAQTMDSAIKSVLNTSDYRGLTTLADKYIDILTSGNFESVPHGLSLEQVTQAVQKSRGDLFKQVQTNASVYVADAKRALDRGFYSDAQYSLDLAENVGKPYDNDEAEALGFLADTAGDIELDTEIKAEIATVRQDLGHKKDVRENALKMITKVRQLAISFNPENWQTALRNLEEAEAIDPTCPGIESLKKRLLQTQESYWSAQAHMQRSQIDLMYGRGDVNGLQALLQGLDTQKNLQPIAVYGKAKLKEIQQRTEGLNRIQAGFYNVLRLAQDNFECHRYQAELEGHLKEWRSAVFAPFQVVIAEDRYKRFQTACEKHAEDVKTLRGYVSGRDIKSENVLTSCEAIESNVVIKQFKPIQLLLAECFEKYALQKSEEGKSEEQIAYLQRAAVIYENLDETQKLSRIRNTILDERTKTAQGRKLNAHIQILESKLAQMWEDGSGVAEANEAISDLQDEENILNHPDVKRLIARITNKQESFRLLNIVKQAKQQKTNRDWKGAKNTLASIKDRFISIEQTTLTQEIDLHLENEGRLIERFQVAKKCHSEKQDGLFLFKWRSEMPELKALADETLKIERQYSNSVREAAQDALASFKRWDSDGKNKLEQLALELRDKVAIWGISDKKEEAEQRKKDVESLKAQLNAYIESGAKREYTEQATHELEKLDTFKKEADAREVGYTRAIGIKEKQKDYSQAIRVISGNLFETGSDVMPNVYEIIATLKKELGELRQNQERAKRDIYANEIELRKGVQLFDSKLKDLLDTTDISEWEIITRKLKDYEDNALNKQDRQRSEIKQKEDCVPPDETQQKTVKLFESQKALIEKLKTIFSGVYNRELIVLANLAEERNKLNSKTQAFEKLEQEFKEVNSSPLHTNVHDWMKDRQDYLQKLYDIRTELENGSKFGSPLNNRFYKLKEKLEALPNTIVDKEIKSKDKLGQDIQKHIDNRSTFWVLSTLGILGILAVSMVYLYFITRPPPPPPTPTQIPTPIPTQTPIIITATPEPTKTPTVTPTSTNTPTATPTKIWKAECPARFTSFLYAEPLPVVYTYTQNIGFVNQYQNLLILRDFAPDPVREQWMRVRVERGGGNIAEGWIQSGSVNCPEGVIATVYPKLIPTLVSTPTPPPQSNLSPTTPLVTPSPVLAPPRDTLFICQALSTYDVYAAPNANLKTRVNQKETVYITGNSDSQTPEWIPVTLVRQSQVDVIGWMKREQLENCRRP